MDPEERVMKIQRGHSLTRRGVSLATVMTHSEQARGDQPCKAAGLYKHLFVLSRVSLNFFLASSNLIGPGIPKNIW